MKNQFKSIFICLLTLLLVGCGIINTTVRGDSVARSNLNRVKSPCETIPRIYSGVFYDCVLRGKPSQAALWLGSGAELMLVDIEHYQGFWIRLFYLTPFMNTLSLVQSNSNKKIGSALSSNYVYE